MTLGSHQKTVGDSQSWITPKHIIEALGPFDLDPCACDPQPWPCARENWVRGGLGGEPWRGLVWLNPPFNRYGVQHWMARMAQHNNGIALLHARTETDWFQQVWFHATSMLFLGERLHFHYPDGRRAEANSGAPAVLVAYGKVAEKRLRTCGLRGWLIDEWAPQ